MWYDSTWSRGPTWKTKIICKTLRHVDQRSSEECRNFESVVVSVLISLNMLSKWFDVTMVKEKRIRAITVTKIIQWNCGVWHKTLIRETCLRKNLASRYNLDDAQRSVGCLRGCEEEAASSLSCTVGQINSCTIQCRWLGLFARELRRNDWRRFISSTLFMQDDLSEYVCSSTTYWIQSPELHRLLLALWDDKFDDKAPTIISLTGKGPSQAD